MKELYYGRIPLGVPIQKRPPDKYASHPYPVFEQDSYKSASVLLNSGSLDQKSFKGIERTVSGITMTGVILTQVVFEPQHYNHNTPEIFKTKAITLNSGVLTKVLFEPQYYTSDNERFLTKGILLNSGTLTKVLYESIYHTQHPERFKVVSITLSGGKLTEI